MGKQIKSTALTLDGSSMGAAPVSPSGTVRLRPKTDASGLEVSYDGAAYVMFGAGGSGTPGTPASSLQYNNAGTFGGVTSSVVSGANITLGGDLTFSRVASYSTVLFYRENAAAADVANGDVVGGVVYSGKVGGSTLALGYMGAYYESATPLGGVLVLGARDGANARIELKDNAPTPATANSVTLLAAGGTHYVQVQQGGIIFSTGSAGAVWYKESTDILTALAIGTATQVLTVTDIGGGVLRPRWATPAGGGGSGNPGGSASELQFRSTGTSFGAVTSSAVSGANITLGGDLTITQANATTDISIIRTGTNLADGDVVGQIYFTGQVSGSPTTIGAIRGLYEAANGGPTIDMGLSSTSRIYIGTGSTTLVAGSHSIQVQTGGIILSTGSAGAMWYQGATFVTALAIGSTGTFLKSNGSVPGWASLAGSDIASGTVPLARGGTGASLTDPNVDRILFWDDSAGTVDWLTAGSGLTITGTTLTASTATAAGASTELQYRNSGTGAFAAVSGSTVSSIGDLTFTHSNAAFTFQVTRTGTNLADGDIVGQFGFTGQVSGSPTTIGAIRALYEAANGGPTIDMGLSATSRIYIGTGSSTIVAGSHSIQVQTGGIVLSTGSSGAIWYKGATFVTALAIGGSGTFLKSTGSAPSWASLAATDIASGTLALARGGTGSSLTDPNADRILFWDDSAGAVDWLTVSTGLSITGTTLTATGGAGGSPGGSGTELQYRSGASTFGAVTSSSVSGANVTLGGDITFTQSNATTDIQVTRTGTNLADGDVVGQILFTGQVSGIATTIGAIRGLYEAANGGPTIDIGLSSTSRLYIGTSSATLLSGGNFVQVQSGGIRLSTGSAGAMWYQGATFITALAIGGSGTFLKSNGSVPSWASLAGSDIGSGTVALARGGTGSSLVDPNADRIMFWDDSGGVVDWLTAGSGLSISGTTITSTLAGGSSLAGSVTLTDSTLTTLFTITFASTSDHKAVGGEVHMVMMAKQTSGSTQTQVYRRKVHFVVGKLATANTTAVDIRQDSGVGSNQVASFGGFSQIQHAVNSGSAVDMTTAITTGSLPEAITYKVLVNSDLTTFSQFTCYFLVQYQGDSGITIA